MSKVKRALMRIFKRGHPDIYDALKKYCEDKGLNPSDVVASAVATWLATDEEGKAELEQAMAKRRTAPSGMDFKMLIGMFKDMCDAMSSMFRAMNEARANMSLSAMISDFEAVSGALERMRSKAAEKGTGSAEDLLYALILSRLFPNLGQQVGKLRTGVGSIKKVED